MIGLYPTYFNFNLDEAPPAVPERAVPTLDYLSADPVALISPSSDGGLLYPSYNSYGSYAGGYGSYDASYDAAYASDSSPSSASNSVLV